MRGIPQKIQVPFPKKQKTNNVFFEFISTITKNAKIKKLLKDFRPTKGGNLMKMNV